MPPDHPGLSASEVLARGGWHPRYARVLAVASDGDYGFAVVDGNAYFAYGHAAGRRSITISFDGRRYTVPVARYGVWAFIKIRTTPHGDGLPALVEGPHGPVRGPRGARGEGLPPVGGGPGGPSPR